MFVIKDDKYSNKHTSTSKRIITCINDIEEYNISHIDDIHTQIKAIRDILPSLYDDNKEKIENHLLLIEEYLSRI